MSEKEKLGDLITENKENAKELSDADIKVNSDKDKIEKKISTLILENEQNSEELSAAYKKIATQEKEIKKQAADLIRADKEKEKRRAELISAKKELAHKAELTIANKELSYQIEKRKQTELALNESNEKYSKAFQSSPYLIIISNMEDGKIIEVNDTFVSISGFTRKESLSNSAIGINMWVDKGERNSVISALRSGKDVEGKEFQFRKKNGEIMIGLYSARIIYVNKEALMISSIDDITERRKAEYLLKESEHKAILIMENSADAIFVANQKGEYISTNKEVSALLGYTSEEMKSKTIAELTDPNKHEEIFKIFNQVINKGKSYTEIELLKKDGNYIATDLNAVLLPDGTVYGSCRDITGRKKAELELIKAKEKAEESDRLKSAFLTNMSHEIRTPMNGILGFADLLKTPNLTGEEQQNYIQIIEKSGQRMLNTINDIVDISKIESGLVKVDIQETNINAQMEFTYKLFKPEVESKGIQFFLKNGLSGREDNIKTDNKKVDRILTNLVKNAVKFTHKGSIELGYVKKGEYLEFYVKDTGIGIPKDRLDAIFKRFIKADIEDKQAFQGSGLGLTISKSYVEMLGGKMWIESEEGLGSTFYFTIPYNAIEEENTEVLNAVPADDNEVKIENLKILIVEDDEVSGMLLEMMVNTFAKNILKAKTGVEAIETCRNNPDIDLILMDIQMPQMNGYEATRQIREFNNDVVIIAQTAFGLSGDREKANETGCNDYISKPINKTLLRELIIKHCNK